MRKYVFLLGLFLTPPLFADRTTGNQDSALLQEDRRTLHHARQNYGQAVQRYGPHSPEALSARAELRASRRTFHAHRRAVRAG